MFAIRLANELSLTQNVFFIELHPERTVEKRQIPLLDKKIILLQPSVNAENCFLDEQVIGFIKKNKITHVNSHSWDSDVYFASLKKKIRFQLISSFHGHYEFLAQKRINFNAITKCTITAIDKIIYTSPIHQKTLDNYKVPSVKSHKIFYGVSISLAEKITKYKANECLNIVMAARGIKEKGWEEAILAVLELLKKYPGLIKLNLLGEGPHLDFLKTKYKDSSIRFLGYKNNVIRIIKDAHIGILPTYFVGESMPNTIIEYLFCGKPVITTNVGAINEMITWNKQLAGMCIDLCNDKVEIDLISAAIENYINNPLLVEKHSALALKASEKFRMESCIESYLNVFSENYSYKN